MALKAVVESLDGLPDAIAELYVARDGKFALQVDGMVPTAEVEGLKSTVRALRTEKAGLADKLSKWSALGDDPSSVQATLDEVPSLRKAAEIVGGGNVKDKIEEAARERVEAYRRAADREKADLAAKLSEASASVAQFEARERSRKVRDAIREAAVRSKVIPEAVDDLLMFEGMFDVADDGKILTKDGVGVAPGIEPGVWLGEHLSSRPHLLPVSKGGGARGGAAGADGDNPWSKKGWNVSRQHEIATRDRARAEQMAKSAGSAIGAYDPPQ